MAREARVSCGLTIRKDNIDFRAYPASFTADVSEASGPTPGEFEVGPYGKAVDLSSITTPGLCWIQNRSSTFSIIVGIHDGASFFPLLEFLPGEAFPMRLWRHLGEEFTGTGTGTPSDVNRLWISAIGGTARVFVGAFGK